MSERKKLKFLSIVMNAIGHMNACQGLCDRLLANGHDVAFLIDKEFSGYLKPYGYMEYYYSMSAAKLPENDQEDKNLKFWQWFLKKYSHLYRLSPLEQMEKLNPIIFRTMFDQQCMVENVYADVIKEYDPDVIISDCYVSCPAIICSGKPWIWLFSAAPQALIQDSRLPPFYSGLQSNGDKQEWQKFQQKTNESLQSLFNDINNYCMNKGMQSLNNRLHPLSPYLNLFMWPKELRYNEWLELPKNFYGIDNLIKKNINNVKNFEIPEKLLKYNQGKLILFSMGSFGTANIDLMERLLKIFSKSPNRFIVSTGSINYQLYDNQWGDKFLPQNSILPLVDLVITHGGNNTVMETFYFGKKMLVLPTFVDQFDNAQRIVECGFGARLNPFHSNESEFLTTIQLLLDDEHLTQRMSKIGERIRREDDENKKKLVEYIENLFSK